MTSAKIRLLIDSRKATLAPLSTTRAPSGSSLPSSSTLASASSCDLPGADVAVDADARSRSWRVIACSAGALLVVTSEAAAPAAPLLRADAQARQVLGARALVGEEAHPHVDAPPAGGVLADAIAADERVDGGGHLLDGDAEVGGARAVGDDAQLGHADLVVGVDVDDERRWPRAPSSASAQLSMSLSQSEPRTENSTGKPRCAVKPAARGPAPGAEAGDGAQLLAQLGLDLAPGSSCARRARTRVTLMMPLLTSRADAADVGEDARHLGAGA